MNDIKLLQALLAPYDDEFGVNQTSFDNTATIIETICGRKARLAFTDVVGATDNRFYFRNGVTVKKAIIYIVETML